MSGDKDFSCALPQDPTETPGSGKGPDPAFQVQMSPVLSVPIATLPKPQFPNLQTGSKGLFPQQSKQIHFGHSALEDHKD